jgi:hypothetical protein
MSEEGFIAKVGKDLSRLEISCEHQKGILYVVPSELSWVCDDANRHNHSLAGFLKELTLIGNPQVKEAMQKWGLYYRELPIDTTVEEE